MTPADAQKLIVKYFGDKKVRGKKLDFAHSPLDRRRGFFGSRRAAVISSLPANAAMLSDANLVTLKARIDNEFAQFDAFLEDKVKALRPGSTDKTPTHFDLKDLAQPKINTGRYVFGPLLQIGWGTPTVITIDLALILELPDPVRLVLIGELAVLLPTPDSVLLELHMDVIA